MKFAHRLQYYVGALILFEIRSFIDVTFQENYSLYNYSLRGCNYNLRGCNYSLRGCNYSLRGSNYNLFKDVILLKCFEENVSGEIQLQIVNVN